ncbi:MAG: RnfABCDGE type electron transport complex subunit C [Hominimerdicola sp.]
MKINGIFLPHKKGTENSESFKIPTPKTVRIPMLQHNGEPCNPLVKKGDSVLVGQKIGDSGALMSCPVHSSVSGTVIGISEITLAGGKVCKAVEIETDGKQEKSPDVKPPKVFDKKSLCLAVRESGCCGFGGEGFPTHLKLDFDEDKYDIDSLIINACESEPYVTGDYREMLENSDSIISGIKLIKKLLNIEKAYIVIEDNKPTAIKLFREKTADDPSISLICPTSRYPQEAEKVIVYTATDRLIKEGQQAIDQGIIVLNVSAVGFIYNYIQTGMPLVSRRVTIDGDVIKTPCNLVAPIGTTYDELLSFADCNKECLDKLICGGPMTGLCAEDLNTPLCKTTNAILAFAKPIAHSRIEDKCRQTNCIRCGKCIDACPMGLMPNLLEKAYDKKDKATLTKMKINLCINCGACSYICPAKRNLAEKNQLAKELVKS